jgi:AcrR family transcriptional regulator
MTETEAKSARQGAPGASVRPMRADAQRNVERLLAAARESFAAHGANASLDDIARKAGVGSGTLYRHFPTRLSLIEAVYRDGVERLCSHGERLIGTERGAAGLAEWLRDFVTYISQKRGLAGPLIGGLGKDADLFSECHAMIMATGGALLDQAQAAGAVRPDVELMDILRLAGAIAQAGESSPEGAALSERLLEIAIDGLRPRDADAAQRGA